MIGIEEFVDLDGCKGKKWVNSNEGEEEWDTSAREVFGSEFGPVTGLQNVSRGTYYPRMYGDQLDYHTRKLRAERR